VSGHEIVFDSYSLIAFLQDEKGAEEIGRLLKQGNAKDRPLFLSVVNWGEVYYIFHRIGGRPAAQEAVENLDALPIEIVPVDRDLTQSAALFKADFKMSYADCFAAALAQQKKATLVTGDKEFKEVEKLIKVHWI